MFKLRSYKKEMLDELTIPKELLIQNLKELAFINKYLGGHAVSLKAFNNISFENKSSYNIIDVGCGGGDSVMAIAKWLNKKKNEFQITGLDLKQDCINYAKNNFESYCKNITTAKNKINVKFYCDDFRNAFLHTPKPNIVHASLFCHHFYEEEIIEFIKLCNHNKAIFIINELERNAIAYFAIKILTALFSKSVLVKNDAPLSVLRGFKKEEWKAMLVKAGIKKYEILNKWAFRHLIIVHPNE
jgi:2-polyprenyl-3-methyl-5-hydroxy-6-metoxy-1,4-benzoquinol methylase